MKMEELRKYEDVYNRYKDQVNANKNFEVKVMVPTKFKEPVPILTAMKCMHCDLTCHYICNPFWPKN